MSLLSSIGKFAGGIIPGAFNSLTGNDAALRAQRTQEAAGAKAADVLHQNLDPYVQAGQQAVHPLVNFATDPNAQSSFVMNNPLFKQLAEDTSRRLFANQAARSKLGSGSTAVDLNNQILPLGQNMAQQYQDNLYRTAALGENAASNQATQLADNYTNVGNATAAGIVGRSNNNMSMIKNIAGVVAAPFTGGLSLGMLGGGNPGLGVGQQAAGSGVAVGQLPSNVAANTYRNPLFAGA